MSPINIRAQSSCPDSGPNSLFIVSGHLAASPLAQTMTTLTEKPLCCLDASFIYQTDVVRGKDKGAYHIIFICTYRARGSVSKLGHGKSRLALTTPDIPAPPSTYIYIYIPAHYVTLESPYHLQ